MSVDWDSADWGNPATCVHLGTSVSDAHDVSEAAAEGRRG